MGISQVPPVPTPVSKGDIVVGTSAGPTRLPVSTTANQTLLTDSTTTTGLKYGAVSLTTTLRVPNGPSSFNITGFSYTNPNITINTSAAHNFQVGNYVVVSGVVQASTVSINTTYTVTAVTATSFTASFGATAPSTYTSGGVASVYFSGGGSPNGGKYLSNGVYVLTDGPNYFYSSDAGVTWNSGQIPSNANYITSIDYDGTTYVVSAGTSGIYTSSSLAQGSWTNRSNFGGFHCNGVVWCAGSVNRWVAFGSGDSDGLGGSARVEVTATATGSWTNQTLTGTNSAAGMALVFDGTSTIWIPTLGSGPLVSTSGAGSWAFTTSALSYNNIGANQGYGITSTPYYGFWNSVQSRWVGFSGSVGYMGGLTTTSGAPNTYWQRQSKQNFMLCGPWRASGRYANAAHMNAIVPDLVNSRFFVAKISGGTFNIITYSATSTVYNTYQEFFPITGVAYAPNMFTEIRITSLSSPTNDNTRYGQVYGNGKWCLLQVNPDNSYAAAWTIAVVE